MAAVTVFVNDHFDTTVVGTPGEAVVASCSGENDTVDSGQRAGIPRACTQRERVSPEENFESSKALAFPN